MYIKPGDVCTIIDSYYHPEHVGLECAVVAVAGERVDTFDNPVDVLIKIPDAPSPYRLDGLWLANSKHLKRKQPPQQLGSWEKIEKLTGWNPTKTKAVAAFLFALSVAIISTPAPACERGAYLRLGAGVELWETTHGRNPYSDFAAYWKQPLTDRVCLLGGWQHMSSIPDGWPWNDRKDKAVLDGPFLSVEVKLF